MTKEGVGGGEQDGIASLQRANRKDSKGRKKDADRRPRQAGDAQRVARIPAVKPSRSKPSRCRILARGRNMGPQSLLLWNINLILIRSQNLLDPGIPGSTGIEDFPTGIPEVWDPGIADFTGIADSLGSRDCGLHWGSRTTGIPSTGSRIHWDCGPLESTRIASVARIADFH